MRQRNASRETVYAHRWFRKGAGRIAKSVARDLARRQLAGCVSYGTDFLDGRNVAREWSRVKDWPDAARASIVERMKRFAVDKFFHYGPRFGEWPGEWSEA